MLRWGDLSPLLQHAVLLGSLPPSSLRPHTAGVTPQAWLAGLLAVTLPVLVAQLGSRKALSDVLLPPSV